MAWTSSAWTPETLVGWQAERRPQGSAWEAAPCPRAADLGPAGPRLEQPESAPGSLESPPGGPWRCETTGFSCGSGAVGVPGPHPSSAIRMLLGTEPGTSHHPSPAAPGAVGGGCAHTGLPIALDPCQGRPPPLQSPGAQARLTQQGAGTPVSAHSSAVRRALRGCASVARLTQARGHRKAAPDPLL